MLGLKAETILVDFKDVGNAKVKKGVFSSEILNRTVNVIEFLVRRFLEKL